MFEHQLKPKHDPFASKRSSPASLPGSQQLSAPVQYPPDAIPRGDGPASREVASELTRHRAAVMSHWVEQPSPVAAHTEAVTNATGVKPEQTGLAAGYTHPASANHAEAASPNPDAWYRFTQPVFAMPSGRHDIFQPVSHFDTGHAALNMPLNALYSLSNLAAIPFNAISNLAALPEEAIRAVGGNQHDVAAFNFASMMVGVGEVNMATEAMQGMRAASELKTAGQAAQSSLVDSEMAAIRAATPDLAELSGKLKLATKKTPLSRVGHSAAGAQIGERWPEIVHQVGGPAQSSANPVLSTLQIAKGGWPTKVVPFSERARNYENLSLGVSGENAARSLAYERMLQRLGDTGSYNILNNSCASTAREILEAGGLKPAFWARSPELLKAWFKMQGGK